MQHESEDEETQKYKKRIEIKARVISCDVSRTVTLELTRLSGGKSLLRQERWLVVDKSPKAQTQQAHDATLERFVESGRINQKFSC
jgi:hypothetical protein